MNQENNNLQGIDFNVQEMHYYGIISGISKKINLIEDINQMTNSNPQKKVSVGQSVLALMLNGMGLTLSKPLYLVANFFNNKPLEHLIGEGIVASDLNDDTLGRALDAIADCGTSKIFSTIALKAASTYNIDTKILHGDTSNVQVWGDYEEDGSLITFGYPKNGRSDLKQYLLSLIASYDGAIPLFMGSLRGNTSDAKHFKDLIDLVEENIKNSTEDSYFMLDSAAYSEENLKAINNVFLITRVPERIKAVKDLKKEYMSLDKLDGNSKYKFAEVTSNYGGIDQRWIIVYSQAAHDRAKKTVQALVKKEKTEMQKALLKLKRIPFSCQEDCMQAVKDLVKTYKFHTTNMIKFHDTTITIKLKNSLETTKKETSYMLEDAQIEELTEIIQEKMTLDSMFVLATNQLDAEKLPQELVLKYYKGQSKLENRFNIFKNAACIASKVFLKNEKRIEALVMIMCLCLLIYSLAEKEVRKALIEKNKTFPNQSNKAIQNPTMKWIFQLFEGVIFVAINVNGHVTLQIKNLTNTLKDVLGFLGKECSDMYFLQYSG